MCVNNRYADIKLNDIANGEGVCVSFWTQGCDVRCKGCHNPDTWDFNGGKILPDNYLDIIDKGISANSFHRNFSVLGGEPLCKQNKELTLKTIKYVRGKYPDITIYLWTGHRFEEFKNDKIVQEIFSLIDILIDGPYDDNHRDIRLKFRGSPNQRVIDVKQSIRENKIILLDDEAK